MNQDQQGWLHKGVVPDGMNKRDLDEMFGDRV
jgi:hypothetical protein